MGILAARPPPRVRSVLTPLQREVAEIIAGLHAAERFGLAGGAAMILRGDVDRRTQDLDFFGLDSSDVQRLLPAAEDALRTAGFDVHRLQEGPSFVRLTVERSGEVVEVDLAADARLFPVEVESGLPTLSPTELAVDKVLAVFGRAEARDFVDLAAVIDRYELASLFRLAAEKDPGFSIAVFSDMLERFGRLRSDEFGLSDSGYRSLDAQVKTWRDRSQELVQQLGRERGHDQGLGR